MHSRPDPQLRRRIQKVTRAYSSRQTPRFIEDSIKLLILNKASCLSASSYTTLICLLQQSTWSSLIGSGLTEAACTRHRGPWKFAAHHVSFAADTEEDTPQITTGRAWSAALSWRQRSTQMQRIRSGNDDCRRSRRLTRMHSRGKKNEIRVDIESNEGSMIKGSEFWVWNEAIRCRFC